MRTDKFGQIIYDENDLLNAYMSNLDFNPKYVLVEKEILFSSALELKNTPLCIKYEELDKTIEEFDEILQDIWFIPDEYKNFDIAKYVLDLCRNEEEMQRTAHELLLFEERGMMMLLRYLKYLVDTMREKNIVWGVGRGSSVASYVLYLLGVHKIDSIYYGLDITEFLK